MKKVLFISYYFPPAGGSAVQRALKFVKYLPRFGWNPIVLTAKMNDYALKDESLLANIPPGIRAYRSSAPDFYRFFSKLDKNTKHHADLTAIAVNDKSGDSIMNRLAFFLRNTFFIPDARILWLPSALLKGLKIIKKEGVELIFTTSPPFTTAIVGMLLSKMTGIPWISDYRDPWTQAYYYFNRPKPSKMNEEYLEKKCLVTAKKIISINEPLLSGLSEKYQGIHVSESSIIPNGFDPDDFKNLKPIKDNYFTMTYTGTQNARMHAGTFLQAVKKLCLANPLFYKKIRLNFIGRIGPDIKRLFEDQILRKRIHIFPHMSHHECLRYTAGSDILLLLIPNVPNNELIVTGKLFEYLITGNPILCLSKSGEAASILKATNTGVTVPFDDVGQITGIIWKWYKRWDSGKQIISGPIRQEEIFMYDRKKCTARLADVFNDILNQL